MIGTSDQSCWLAEACEILLQDKISCCFCIALTRIPVLAEGIIS